MIPHSSVVCTQSTSFSLSTVHQISSQKAASSQRNVELFSSNVRSEIRMLGFIWLTNLFMPSVTQIYHHWGFYCVYLHNTFLKSLHRYEHILCCIIISSTKTVITASVPMMNEYIEKVTKLIPITL